MRSRFDEQLALLNRELIEMGALCEEVIALSAQALTEGNAELAARVAPLDQICRRINSTGHVYEDDVAELKDRQLEIWELLKVRQRDEL